MTATPRPSSTVVLVRDSERGPELLFVRRRAGDAFGEAYTFPGGVLDDNESEARSYCEGLGEERANALFGIESGALEYFNAVVRELYEETGLLLGAEEPPDPEWRRQLNSGELSWAEFLEQHGLAVQCDTLHYFTHWITPSALPKRWTTRFFLAAAPAGQEVDPDGNEITDFCWMTAKEALRAAGDGDREIPYPTRKTIEDFVGRNSLAELIEWAHQRQQHGIPAIQPEIRTNDGKRRIFMPDIAD